MSERIHSNLRDFLREHFVEILEREGGKAKLERAVALLYERLAEIDPTLETIPTYQVIMWVIGDGRVGIRHDDGIVTLLTPGGQVSQAEAKILRLCDELGAIMVADVADSLGIQPRVAAELLRVMVRKGLLAQARAHDVRSKVPRRILIYGRAQRRSQLLHDFGKRMVRELMPLEEFKTEVPVEGGIVDLLSEKTAVEVVTSRQNDAQIQMLRKKLEDLAGIRRIVVAYHSSSRELRLILNQLSRLSDVAEVLSLFDLARRSKKGSGRRK